MLSNRAGFSRTCGVCPVHHLVTGDPSFSLPGRPAADMSRGFKDIARWLLDQSIESGSEATRRRVRGLRQEGWRAVPDQAGEHWR